MEARISPSSVSGDVRAPPSKSYTHRAVLASGYGDGGLVRDPLLSADTRATARVVGAFGGAVRRVDDGLKIKGFEGEPELPPDVVDCENSGTTIRIAAATAALAEGLTVLTGDDSLRSRPQGPLLEAIQSLGGRAESTHGNGQAPLIVGGPIRGGEVSIPGNISSQYVTALLMAGAATEHGITIDLETELKSAPYVEVTRELLADFGVDTETTDDGFRVPGNQHYRSPEGGYQVPSDFSSASYILAAGVLAGDPGVRVAGARPSPQGDTAIVDIIDRMGGEISWDRDAGVVSVEESTLDAITIDVGDTPDLLPTAAVLGAYADGETRIENCVHARFKETDRVMAMAEELERLGITVTERRNSLTIHGDVSDIEGGEVDARGDHRLVMALSVAGLAAEEELIVKGAEHADVSYPGFFETLGELGAEVAVME